LQIIWSLPVKISIYAKDRNSVMFPVIEKCPICGTGAKLVRHGFYSRYALFRNRSYRLDICRYLCRSCLKTISLLPWFLLPYFQHTRNTILMTLRNWLSGRPAFVCRQLVAFYRQRFYQNIPAIITALRETGWLDSLPENDKEKAIKVVDRLMITITTPSRYSNRVLTNFMASSFYH